MKKTILLALAAILLSFNARAFDNQHSYYGLTVNLNTNLIDEGGTYSQTFGNVFPMVGMDFGFYMQQQLYSRFVLVSGLKYSFTVYSENNSVSMDGMTYNVENTKANHALTIPVKFGYTGDLPRNWTFTVYAGPSLQFDVATTKRLKDNEGNYDKWDFVNGKYSASSNTDGKVNLQYDELKGMKWFDVPVGLGVTFKHKHVGIKVEYEYGLINRYKVEKINMDDLRLAAMLSGRVLPEGKLKWNSHQVSIGAVFTF